MTLSINCVSPSSVFLFFFFFVSHVAAAVVVDGRSLLMAEARVTLPPTPYKRLSARHRKETLRKLHFQQTCKNTPTVIPQVNLTRLAGWRNFM